MKKISFAFLFAFFGICSCNHSDPDPNPAPILSVTLKSAEDNLAHYWVFATDINGKLLDVRRLPVDTTVILEANDNFGESLVFTVFYYSEVSGYHFTSYSGIARNSTIALSYGHTWRDGPALEGNANISVLDYPNSIDSARLHFSNGLDWVFPIPTSSTSYTASVPLLAGHHNILVSGFDGSTPVYTWFDNVSTGQTLSKSLTEFTPYEKKIPLDFDGEIYGSIKGKNNLNELGFWFSELLTNRSTNPNVPSLGYFEGYPYYDLNISSGGVTTGGRTTYTKLNGDVPTNINLPKFDFNVINSSIGGFDFSFAGSYDYRYVLWGKGAPIEHDRIMWFVYSENSKTPKFTEIPNAIKSAFPNLKTDLSQFDHYETTFFKRLDVETYSSFLNHVLFAGAPNLSLEYTMFQYW